MCIIAASLFAVAVPPNAFCANFRITTSTGSYSCIYLSMDDLECACYDGTFRINVPNANMQSVTILQENQPALTFNLKDVTFSKLREAVNTLSDRQAESTKVKRLPKKEIVGVPNSKKELMKMLASQETVVQNSTPRKDIAEMPEPRQSVEEMLKPPDDIAKNYKPQLNVAGMYKPEKSDKLSQEEITKNAKKLNKLPDVMIDVRPPTPSIASVPDESERRSREWFQKIDNERERMLKENAENFQRSHDERANSGPVYGGPPPFGVPNAPPINGALSK